MKWTSLLHCFTLENRGGEEQSDLLKRRAIYFLREVRELITIDIQDAPRSLLRYLSAVRRSRSVIQRSRRYAQGRHLHRGRQASFP